MKISRRKALCEFAVDTNFDGVSAPSIDPLLKRIYENRNVSGPREVAYSLGQLQPPHLLKDIGVATEIIAQAIKSDSSIMVVGDYDTDGATATTLAILGLQSLGAKHVEYLVPNRFEFGYGLSEKIAQLALARSPDLLITVDNGISSVDGVALLNQNSVKTVITDHHLAGSQLPDADAIVNPNQPLCEFPSKALAGVGVMFYVLLSVRAALRKEAWFSNNGLAEPNLADFLDLVALGTVADMVPLDANNRILVSQGIARIRSGKCRPGIIELLNVANKDNKNVVSSDFGFVIGPRLNAAGRLEDISLGIDCLLTSSHQTAFEAAQVLNEINVERRRIEKVMQGQAFDIVNQLKFNADSLGTSTTTSRAENEGYCLFDPSWHQGVTGLVASRVKDKTNQPAIAFAPAGEGLLTGSARTITGIHIRDLLEGIADKQAGLVRKFGGHAMAAGLTIGESELAEFENYFHEAVSKAFLASNDIDFAVKSDGEISFREMDLDYADFLRNAAPWGQGFPSPVFDGVFDVLEQRVVGGQHIKFVLKSRENGVYDAIAFKAVEPDEAVVRYGRINAVYQLDVNEFRGQRSLQLIIERFAPEAEISH